MSGIYIHVPFCKQKCTYCDFASYPRELCKAESYFACLYREIDGRSKQFPGRVIDTIYIGGGTPSIVDAKFKTFGCTAAIATSSTATEMIIGKTVEEALTITNKKVVEVLGGLPSQKLHCSVLAEEAIKKAIEDYISKKESKN